MGDRDAAMADFDRATELDLTNAYAFQIRGRVYRIAGEFPRACRLRPNDQPEKKATLQRGTCAATPIWSPARRYPPRWPITTRRSDSARTSSMRSATAVLPAPQRRDRPRHRGLRCRVAARAEICTDGRGIAKLRKGDADGGNADMAAAVALNADVAKEFAKFGLAVATQNGRPGKSVL